MPENAFANLSIAIDVSDKLKKEYKKAAPKDTTYTRWVSNTLSLAIEKHNFISTMYPHFQIIGRLENIIMIRNTKNKDTITLTLGKKPECSIHGNNITCECMAYAFFSAYKTRDE
jgi:hypothetical protein